MEIKLKNLKIVIVILAILLVISLVALVSIFAFWRNEFSKGTDVVFDNVIQSTETNAIVTEFNTERQTSYTDVIQRKGLAITPLSLRREIVDYDKAKQTVLMIYRDHPSDSTPFALTNMFPGDSETKSYFIEVSHRGTVAVRFYADIRDGYEKLAEVLKCRVFLADENVLLYDGLMRDMQELLWRITAETGQTTKLRYDITVYLDTSVGNEYMNKSLVADFRWYVLASGGCMPEITDDSIDTDDQSAPVVSETEEPEESKLPYETQESSESADSTETTSVDDGELIPSAPQTSDNFNIWVLLAVAILSLLAALLLFFLPRRKKDD